MASVREVSSFTEDLLCPICLCLFCEPHILQCGHSFCAPCLEPCIPTGESSGLCPQCRQPFTLRHMNRALCSLAKKARLLKLDEGTQLSGTGIWYFCEEHEEPLKLFCNQDKEPVCIICLDLPQHRGHNFLPTKNAVQTYQDQLKASLKPLEEGLRRLKRSQCHQQQNILKLKTCSKSLSDHISEEFMKMHQVLNDKELAIKQALENQTEKNLAQMETKLKELDCKMASHSETLCRVQASLECKDHISFLKEAKELLERVRKEQGAPGEPKVDAELVGEDGLGVSSEDTGECENEIDEDVDEEEEETAEEEEEEKEEDEDGVVAVDLNLGEFKGPLQYYAWKELLGELHPVPARITLDSNSAHPSLVLTEKATRVKFSPAHPSSIFTQKPTGFTFSPAHPGLVLPQNATGITFSAGQHSLVLPQKATGFTFSAGQHSLVLPQKATGIKLSLGQPLLCQENPERFISTPCVVGAMGITTGRFYWEVDVRNSTNWIVGMAKNSVKRKEKLNFLPKEGVWAIELKAPTFSSSSEYQALSEPRTPLSVCGKMEKVGVYLDFEGGQLSFYNSSSMTHLYTFQACFQPDLTKDASMLPFLSTQSDCAVSVFVLEL